MPCLFLLVVGSLQYFCFEWNLSSTNLKSMYTRMPENSQCAKLQRPMTKATLQHYE